LKQPIIEGENPVYGEGRAGRGVSKSGVVWDCSPKWELNLSILLRGVKENNDDSLSKGD